MNANARVAPGWSDWEVYRTKKWLRNADMLPLMLEELIPTVVGVVAFSRRAAVEQWW